MTKPRPRDPITGLNSAGTGRGLKIVTKPLTKKRGASKDRTAIIPINRQKYVDTSAVPVAKLAEVVDPNKPLTEKAKLFVKYWAQGESIASAAARAGYGDGATYAYRLTHYPQVKALYAEEKRLYEEAAQMTRKKVMDGLLEGIEMAKMVSEPASVIRGWREVGLMCGYYEPTRVNVNVSGNVEVRRLNSMSDAELLRLIQEGAQQDLLAVEQGRLSGSDDEA